MAVLEGEKFQADSVDDETFLDGNLDENPETELTATPGEEPEAETPATPEAETTGPERDPETGKFVAKERKEGESAEEPAALTPEATAETPSTTPEALAAAAATGEPVDPGEPLVFKVSGKDYTLEGAKVFKDGLYVPTEQVENAKRAIAEGTYYRANWQAIEQQSIRKGYDKALAEAPEIRQAKALMQQMEPLLADPEAAAQFLTDFHTNAPILRARAEVAMARDELEALRTGTRQQEESGQQERLQQERQTTLSETMKELRSVADTQILTKEDWAAIDRQVGMLNQRGALFRTLDNGPEGPGDYLDTNAIEEIAAFVLGNRKQVADATKKAEEAAKFNAANKPKPGAAIGRPGSAAVAPRKGGAPVTATVGKPDPRDVADDFLHGRLDFPE